MAESGSKQIPVVGLEDKREITVLLAATAAGTLLPPQVIYQGKTTGCHAKVAFPDKWHITHSESHWSNEQTMLEYLENIIILYVTSTRQALDLPEDQPALALFDVLAAHRSHRSGGCRNSNGGDPKCAKPTSAAGGGRQKFFAKIAFVRRVLASFGHFYMLYHPFLRRSKSPLGCSHTLSCFSD